MTVSTADPSVAFSVCIPNFNYGHYIGATIRSVLNQTYPHYEIVVVDNASTDNSVEIVEAIQAEPGAEDRIRLYRNPYNVGFAPNLDRAAVQARHPFIIVLSSDDLMMPTALEEYARVIRALGEDAYHALIVSSIDYVDGKGQVLKTLTREHFLPLDPEPASMQRVGDPQVAVFDGHAVFRHVFPRNSVPGAFCATAYSRRLYDRVGGYSSLHTVGPDADFANKVLLQGAKVAFIDRRLFQYRIHGDNQTSQNKGVRSLRVPIDWYLFTLQYRDEDLARAGVQRSASVRTLVDQACLNEGLLELKNGATGQAFRLLSFAFAANPGAALRNPKSYLLALLLLGGPVGSVAAQGLWRLREWWLGPDR